MFTAVEMREGGRNIRGSTITCCFSGGERIMWSGVAWTEFVLDWYQFGIEERLDRTGLCSEVLVDPNGLCRELLLDPTGL